MAEGSGGASDALSTAAYEPVPEPGAEPRSAGYDDVRNPYAGLPPEVIKADPTTCRHVVVDEMVGARWSFEDCISCGKRFPARDDIEPGERP